MPNTLKLIKKEVGKGLKNAGLTLPAILIKVTAGTRTPGAQSGGTNPTETSYAARGFAKTTTRDKIGGELVEKLDVVICLPGQLIASGQIPTSNDKITFKGTTNRVIAVDFDAAEALYVCLTRA